MTALFELLTVANLVTHAPPLLTAVGVAYLVAVDRRRASELAHLRGNVESLIVGHGSADTHAELIALVGAQLKAEAHAHGR